MTAFNWFLAKERNTGVSLWGWVFLRGLNILHKNPNRKSSVNYTQEQAEVKCYFPTYSKNYTFIDFKRIVLQLITDYNYPSTDQTYEGGSKQRSIYLDVRLGEASKGHFHGMVISSSNSFAIQLM